MASIADIFKSKQTQPLPKNHFSASSRNKRGIFLRVKSVVNSYEFPKTLKEVGHLLMLAGGVTFLVGAGTANPLVAAVGFGVAAVGLGISITGYVITALRKRRETQDRTVYASHVNNKKTESDANKIRSKKDVKANVDITVPIPKKNANQKAIQQFEALIDVMRDHSNIMQQEGIFRCAANTVKANTTETRDLITKFKNMEESDSYGMGNILALRIKEVCSACFSTAEKDILAARAAELSQIGGRVNDSLDNMPEPYDKLITFLAEVASHNQFNLMTSSNLSLCFSPRLIAGKVKLDATYLTLSESMRRMIKTDIDSKMEAQKTGTRQVKAQLLFGGR